jgi:hypothetical protein
MKQTSFERVRAGLDVSLFISFKHFILITSNLEQYLDRPSSVIYIHV